MIAMVQQGRLGNQVFQYLGLRAAGRPGERLLLLGFSSLQDVFEGVDAVVIPIERSPLRHLQSLDYTVWGRRLKSWPGVGTITESATGEPLRSRGSRLAVSEPAWFQSGTTLASPALAQLRVRPQHLASAREAAAQRGVNLAHAAFVQIRAGDYRSWPSPQHPALLSPEWYRARMAELRSSTPELPFVAIGDETDYVAEVVDGIDGVLMMRESEAVEFAAMTLCSSGVLSASSFAFWGAYFGHRSKGTGTYLAPDRWAGHAEGVWYPPNLRANFLTYVP